MMDALAIIRALDALLILAANAGISIAKVQELRAENEDGSLSEAQVAQLAAEADEARARL